MRIGIPREIKDGEFRVALTPRGVAALRNVVVEPGAGLGVGFTDADYVAAGATLGDAWACDLVVKVKELQAPEYGKPRRGQTVFGFQHFAPEPELLEAALARGARSSPMRPWASATLGYRSSRRCPPSPGAWRC